MKKTVKKVAKKKVAQVSCKCVDCPSMNKDPLNVLIKTFSDETDAILKRIFTESEDICSDMAKDEKNFDVDKIQKRVSRVLVATDNLATIHLNSVAKLLKPHQFPVTVKFLSSKAYQVSFGKSKPVTYKAE